MRFDMNKSFQILQISKQLFPEILSEFVETVILHLYQYTRIYAFFLILAEFSRFR